MTASREPLPPELKASVEGYLQRVAQDWAGHPAEVGQIAAQVGAIPLLLDAGGFFALRPDGTVVEVGWERPEVAAPVSSARLRDVALRAAVKRYPELAQLLPSRESDSVPCPQCGGSGTHPMALAAGIDNLVCWCGGFGWIPGYWGETPP